MTDWARRRDKPLDLWHLPTYDKPKPPQRGVMAACEENLGESELEWDHEPVIGDRCPACQGIAIASSS